MRSILISMLIMVSGCATTNDIRLLDNKVNTSNKQLKKQLNSIVKKSNATNNKLQNKLDALNQKIYDNNNSMDMLESELENSTIVIESDRINTLSNITMDVSLWPKTGFPSSSRSTAPSLSAE